MVDSILKYLSLITVAGAAISFVWGLVKYLDQRNREERSKRFVLFHDLIRRVSGKVEPGSGDFPLVAQVAAVYELQQFDEYAYASVPILEYLHKYFTENDQPPLLLQALDNTLKALRRSPRTASPQR
jgi:hypothetical protein